MRTRTACGTLLAAALACAAARAEEPTLLAQARSGAAFGTLSSLAASYGVESSPAPALGAGRAAAAEARAPRDAGVDLSGQFPGPSRDQGDVGSCHTFATVGLIEAAYFRARGEHLRLSEADLFMRRNVLSTDAYASYLASGSGDLDEGNDTAGTVRYALEHGVATGLQYQDFLRRYRQYRDAERRTLEDIERQARQDPWYVRLFYDHRADWVRLQQDPVNQRILQGYLSGNDGTLERQREETRRAFAGFRLAERSFGGVDAGSMTASRDACRRAGTAQTDAVLGELRAGRPVIIRKHVEGGTHAMIIKGYRVDDAGAYVFLTRNSWGEGGNADMRPDEMCRVYSMLSVRAR